MLPLYTRGMIQGQFTNPVFKLLTLEEALSLEYPLERVMIDLIRTQIPTELSSLVQIGVGGILTESPLDTPLPLVVAHSVSDLSVAQPGDVIRLHPTGAIHVLYRKGANSNSLFVTERCNNYCVMCSQPPTPHDDSWRISEILDFIPLIDKSEACLCITGGEPTLLGSDLNRIIESVLEHLPDTQLFTLTNGRHFSDGAFVKSLATVKGRMLWAIPLYGDSAPRHDFVVQAQGAFNETLNGIYNLAEQGHRIEIRYVIHAQTVERMEKFAEFVYRNLPFVEHLAFMGIEPMGFAKANRESLWIDPYQYTEALTRAAWYLNDRGITASIYNIPLCLLPKTAWPLAKMSISDWKHIYIDECQSCDLKKNCSGFFASFNNDWKSPHIKAFRENGGIYEAGLETVS